VVDPVKVDPVVVDPVVVDRGIATNVRARKRLVGFSPGSME
jgi:hypothetical protein